jgi:uncharacterized protein (DUF433 family)
VNLSERLIAVNDAEPWRRRLMLPAYQVKDAARYARITTQTIRNWQRAEGGRAAALARRAKGAALSYLQLVEVAFVSVMRGMGISLAEIKDTRDYVAQQLQSEYPFAQHRFLTDGQNIIMELRDLEPGAAPDKLVLVGKGGQLAWKEIIARKFAEFDYREGLAVRWHVAGKDSPVVIDPQVAFGAPAIRGVPTWAVSGRKEAGESDEDIAQDFMIDVAEVRKALAFEAAGADRALNARKWTH